jgi:hypothetical protein
LLEVWHFSFEHFAYIPWDVHANNVLIEVPLFLPLVELSWPFAVWVAPVDSVREVCHGHESFGACYVREAERVQAMDPLLYVF